MQGENNTEINEDNIFFFELLQRIIRGNLTPYVGKELDSKSIDNVALHTIESLKSQFEILNFSPNL